MQRSGRTRAVPVRRLAVDGQAPLGDEVVDDVLAVEEPLAIRVAAADGVSQRVAVTMRTPGDDDELAVGWLLAEGVVTGPRDVLDVAWCVRDEHDPVQTGNVVTVTLASASLPDLSALDRHGLVSSACGVCGRASLEALAEAGLPPVTSDARVRFGDLATLPDRLRDHQPTFDATGGLHAAARATGGREVVDVREDVGRHNAVDKLVGAALLDRDLPLDDQVLVLSGRASYELLQKSVVAGVPVVAAIGAPSTLAVQVADAFGITLVGFLRANRANVYTHPDRVVGTPAEADATVAVAGGTR